MVTMNSPVLIEGETHFLIFDYNFCIFFAFAIFQKLLIIYLKKFITELNAQHVN